MELLFQDNYTVQEVLAEHVFSTSESYELKLVFTYTFCNQSIVNNLSTLFRQFLVPRSATGSLIAITGNFVLPIRISLQNLGSQLDVNLAIVVQTGAANLEEDGTRVGIAEVKSIRTIDKAAIIPPIAVFVEFL